MQKNISFKVIQMKFLAMHITYQKFCFYIFTEGNLQNIFMEHDLYLILKFFNISIQVYTSMQYKYVFFRADADTDYYRSSRPITDILNRYMCLV